MNDDKVIIVVEDDASMSHALERLLDAAGWHPRMFNSAEACDREATREEASRGWAGYFPKSFDGPSLIKVVAPALACVVFGAVLTQLWIG
jgi:DNA-binding NtrC family response regulator